MRTAAESTQPAAVVDCRIAIVSDSMPERNGVGAYYADLMRHIGDQVGGIELLCPEDESLGFFTMPLIGDSTQKLTYPVPQKLYRRLRDFDPHVVIVPTPGPFGVLGAIFGRRIGARVIAGFHTDYDKMTALYWGPLIARVCAGYFRFTNKIIFKRSDLVLGNSPQMLEVARALGAKRTELMGTLVARDFLETPASQQRDPIRKILFLGRLAAEKNIPDLLNSVEQLPELEFQIAGDGPMREQVVAKAGVLPNLNYLGWIDRVQARDLIDASDLLVLPSHTESFGTVALEAMARQRLVLVSPNCGIAAWPSLNNALLVMEPGERLADSIRRTIAVEPALRQTRAVQARKAAIELNQRSLEAWLRLLNGQKSRVEISG